MNLPTIPDSFYKILLLVGVAIIVYATYTFDKQEQIRAHKQAIKDSTSVVLNNKIAYNDYYLKKIVENAAILSQRNGIENPIKITDTLIIFTRIISDDPKIEKINDSIFLLYDKYRDVKFDIKQLQKQLAGNPKLEEIEAKIIDLEEGMRNNLFEIGANIILMGGIGIFRQQNLNDKLLKLQVLEKKGYYSYCQSCGKKFNLITKRGTDNNSEIFDGFCSNCYSDGNFVDPILTKEQVIANIIADKNIKSKFRKWIISFKIGTLERWNKNI